MVNLPSGDLARTGVCRGPGVVDQPRVRRRLTTPGTGPGLPTVIDGVAYLGDADGHVCAIDLADDRALWQARHELQHDDGTDALVGGSRVAR